MLPTFVIGLREGLEAALIVGIIAAFLRKQGRRDLLRWVFLGVGVAVAICVAAGVALNVLSKDLPQKQQEGLETVIGFVAVAMVTYMVVWMKRNSRNLKGQLEGLAADAMGGTSGAARAMILMAFLAVLREGVETVVFLLAAFQSSTSGSGAAFGACLGIAVAVVLGYGIYRGGVRINLSKFFRATGLVLVLVAAGIVVNALRTAHEAGWLEAGQGRTVDLTWLVEPGSVQASLLTGMLGVQSRPVVAEVVGWLVYLVPVGVFVAWPPGRSLARRTVSRMLLAIGVVLLIGGAVFALVRPDRPTAQVAAGGASVTATSADSVVVRTATGEQTLRRTGTATVGGLAVEVYSASRPGSAAAALPKTVSVARVAELNGGALPIGLKATGTSTDVAVRYVDRVRTTAQVEPRTDRLVGYRSVETVTASVVRPGGGELTLRAPVSTRSTALSAADAAAARASARDAADTLDRRDALTALAWTCAVLGLVVLLAGAGLAFAPRRREPARAASTPVPTLVKS